MSGNNEWNEKLGDVCKDCGICFFGFCCTPCLFGQNAEKIDDSNCCLWCCLYCIASNCYLCCLPHMMKRQKLREKYDLKEDPCHDCPTTFFCSPCALCQEARELNSRVNTASVSYNSGGGPAVVTQPGANSHNQKV